MRDHARTLLAHQQGEHGLCRHSTEVSELGVDRRELGAIAGLYPAIRAARTRPTAALNS